MAIETVLLESFEGYDNLATEVSGEGGKWESSSEGGVYNFSPPRTGTRALGLSTDGVGWLNFDLEQSMKTVVCGFGLRMTSWPSGISSTPVIQFMNMDLEGNTQVTLAVTTDGYLRVFKGAPGEEGASIIATGLVQLPPGVWHYVEIKVFCDNSAGKVEVRVDGVTVITSNSVDTAVTSTAEIRVLKLTAGNSVYTIAKGFDDLYVRGDVAYSEGGWLGPISIVRLNPNGAAGLEEWVGSYLDINETYLDTGNYIEADNSGEKFICTFDSLVSNRQLKSVQLTAVAQTPSGGSRGFSRVCSTALSEDFYGTEQFATEKRAYVDAMDVDPDTGSAWLKEGLNLTRFGWETS